MANTTKTTVKKLRTGQRFTNVEQTGWGGTVVRVQAARARGYVVLTFTDAAGREVEHPTNGSNEVLVIA